MKSKFIIINLLLISLLTIFTSYLFRYITIQNDPIINELQPFFYVFDHGNYVCSVFAKLTTYTIPNRLGLNPMDFQYYFNSYLKAFIIVITAYIFALIAFFKNKKNMFFTVIFFCIYISLLLLFSYTGFFQIQCNSGFARFIIANLYFLAFWSYYSFLLNQIIIKEKIDYNIIFIALLALFVGNSSEVLCTTTVIALFLLLLRNLFTKNFENKIIIIPLISVVIGGLLMFSHPYYQDSAYSHTGEITVQTLLNSISEWKLFLITYYEEIIYKHRGCYILMILFCTFILVYHKIKNIKISCSIKERMFISFFILIGLLFFYLTFIIAKGDVSSFADEYWDAYNYNHFWLTHHDFVVIIRLVLLLILSMFFSCCLQLIEKNIYKNIICFIVIMILSCCCFFKFEYQKQSIINSIEKMKQKKQEIYIITKLTFDAYKNGYPIIIFDSEYNWLGINDDYLNYLDKIYDIQILSKDIQRKSKEEALDNFRKHNGILTDDELESLCFSDLQKKYDIKVNPFRTLRAYECFTWMYMPRKTVIESVFLCIKNRKG